MSESHPRNSRRRFENARIARMTIGSASHHLPFSIQANTRVSVVGISAARSRGGHGAIVVVVVGLFANAGAESVECGKVRGRGHWCGSAYGEPDRAVEH